MGSKKISVLIVEDVKLQQKIAVMTLEGLSCKIDTADTGIQALELVSKNSYDIIFMDLGLGDTDGLTVTQTIRNMKGKNRSTPIIALTANAEKEMKARCFQVGMNDFMNKPITADAAQAMFDKYVLGEKL